MGRQMTYYFEKVFEKFETLIEDHAIASQQADANDYLTGIGEDISCCYYIKSGICRCSILNDNGEELILSWHGPGSLIPVKCREFHFLLEPSYIIKMITPSQILKIRPSDVEYLVRTCPDFAVAAINYHTVYSNMFCSRQISHTLPTVLSKVATFFFIYLRGFPSSGQCIDLSQEEVASILGVSRVQVARVYQRLRKEGIISSSRKRIQVIHPEGLKKYSSKLIVL